jgi:hypothetical protein
MHPVPAEGIEDLPDLRRERPAVALAAQHDALVRPTAYLFDEGVPVLALGRADAGPTGPAEQSERRALAEAFGAQVGDAVLAERVPDGVETRLDRSRAGLVRTDVQQDCVGRQCFDEREHRS